MTLGMKQQEDLETRLESDIARCFERYFKSKGRSVKHINLSRLVKHSVSIGALNYAASNIELASYLSNNDLGYLKCFGELKKN